MTQTHTTVDTEGAEMGFKSLEDEVDIERLPVLGAVPEWLQGTLLRNGPAKFESERRSFRHWFDGQAMVHRFGIRDGTVSYTNRFLDTPSTRAVREQGQIRYAEFATDPCSSLFSRFFTRFTRKPSTNANVSIVPMVDRVLAMTETPLAVEFDPVTLDTVGVVGYQDSLKGQVTTAHPHVHPSSGRLVNYLLEFSRTSQYHVYEEAGGMGERRLIASVPVASPAYMHSFAITDRYVVLTEFPLVVNPLALALRGRPFIENYRWEPQRGTRFVVIDLHDGGVRATCETDAFFAFHHINASDDGDAVTVDLCAYDDASVIEALYLEARRSRRPVPLAKPVRFRIDLSSRRVRRDVITEEPVELPRIAYGRRNGRDYRFFYGVGARGRTGDDFLNQLVKVDATSGDFRTWAEDGCYPGEPVFVEAPDAAGEDGGVVLSVVLDTRTRSTYLVIIDAGSFEELARAAVPHAIPFGFHGAFTRSAAGGGRRYAGSDR